MEIKINEEVVLKLSDTQVKILKHDIAEEIFYQDIARRVQFIIMEKYKRSLQRIKQEWEPRLKESGRKSIPLDDEKFCELVFSSKEYADKQTRTVN